MNFFFVSIGFAAFVSAYAAVTDKAWVHAVVHGDVVPIAWIVSNLAWYTLKWTWKGFEWFTNGATATQAAPAAERQLQAVPAGTGTPAPVVSPSLYYPTLKLEDLSGMHALKQELAAALEGFRGYAKGTGLISDRNGILLSGPPGNGKTAFAEAIAGELGLPFIKVKGSDVQSRWVNQTGEEIAEFFDHAASQPCVVFFDEFESLAADRAAIEAGGMEDRKAVTALLPAIDDARRKRIVLVAATNYVDQLDSAVMRDGRFDFRIEVPYPDYEARVGILQGLLLKFKMKMRIPVNVTADSGIVTAIPANVTEGRCCAV